MGVLSLQVYLGFVGDFIFVCFLLASCGDSNRVSVFEVPKMEALTYISYM